MVHKEGWFHKCLWGAIIIKSLIWPSDEGFSFYITEINNAAILIIRETFPFAFLQYSFTTNEKSLWLLIVENKNEWCYYSVQKKHIETIQNLAKNTTFIHCQVTSMDEENKH